MKHIIDTDELEKLPKYDCNIRDDDMGVGMWPVVNGAYIKLDDLRALIANSPQANDRTLVDGDYELKLMLSAYKPQADDVRKDAERYRFLRAGKYIHNGEPFIARNFGASFSQWTGDEADKVIDQAIDKARE